MILQYTTLQLYYTKMNKKTPQIAAVKGL